MAYSSVEDLLLGDIPMSARLDREKFVNDATDEIDSYIGHVYQTPINISGVDAVARHSVLLLKRLNNFLATGRLILALDAGGEDSSLHAYGLRLVTEALGTLAQIANGSLAIDGAVPLVQVEPDNGPMLKNADAASGVDAFYNRVMVPENGLYAPSLPYRDWAPGPNPNGSIA